MRMPAQSAWGKLDTTGTRVSLSSGARISSVRRPPHDTSNASAFEACFSSASVCASVHLVASPTVAVQLPATDWTDAMSWIARTPPSSHVLADPGHAWKYGTSVRVAGERDVYLEEVKDVALALYSRDVAMRVLGRIQDAAGFDSITPERALALAHQYDLDYLVIDHDMNLPLAYRNAQFRIYALSPVLSPALSKQ